MFFDENKVMTRPYRTREDERDAFRALASPVRRQIISASIDGPCSLDQLCQLVRRNKATVAAHLRMLRDARLLTAIRTGKSVSYRANRPSLNSSARWLSAVAAIAKAS